MLSKNTLDNNLRKPKLRQSCGFFYYICPFAYMLSFILHPLYFQEAAVNIELKKCFSKVKGLASISGITAFHPHNALLDHSDKKLSKKRMYTASRTVHRKLCILPRGEIKLPSKKRRQELMDQGRVCTEWHVSRSWTAQDLLQSVHNLLPSCHRQLVFLHVNGQAMEVATSKYSANDMLQKFKGDWVYMSEVGIVMIVSVPVQLQSYILTLVSTDSG